MNLHQIASLLSGVIFALSAGYYVYDVAKMKVRPNLTSFIIWSVINVSILVSLIVSNAWGAVPFEVVGTVASVLVCVFSVKNHDFYFSREDQVAVLLTILSALVWLLTQQATWNVYILSFVQAVTFIPLITKSWGHPSYETKFPWQLNLLASFILLLTIPSAAAVQWVVPVRQFVCSLALNLVLLRNPKVREAKA